MGEGATQAAEMVVAVAVAVVVALTLLGPLCAVAVEPAGEIRRTAHMDVRRFSPRQDVVSKNPAGGTDPDRVAGGARRPGCAFFWLLFFAQAKKSNSLTERKLLILLLKLLLLLLFFACWRFTGFQ